MITVSHYEMPLHLSLKYNGWANRKTIGFFVHYCEVLFKRYKGKVKYCILVTPINLIKHESNNHLGILADRVDNLVEANYQGVVNELVACARATKIGHQIDKSFKIGMMLCDWIAYPASCKPEDVFAAMKANQMEYFYGDVLLRGKFPGYAKRFFEDRHFNITLTQQDLRDFKNTADFLSFSFYYTKLMDDESYRNHEDGKKNPYLKANPWGWAIDPIGLRTTLNQ